MLEIAIIAIVLLSLGLQVLIARVSARITRDSAQFLSQDLAAALESILEKLPESLEELVPKIQASEVNPIQMLVASMIQEHIGKPTIEATITPQGDDGRFISPRGLKQTTLDDVDPN